MQLLSTSWWWGGSTRKMSDHGEDPHDITAAQDGGPDWEGREKGSFDSRRGNSIKYRRWSPKVGTKAAAMLIIVHGLHEHSGRWAKVAHSYTERGYLVYANDHIGHGLTAADGDPSDRGLIDDHTKLTDDVTEFVEKMVEKETDKTMPVFMLGHSMGSVIATVSAKQCQQSATVGPRFKKLVLSACPFSMGPSAASPFGIRALFPLTKNARLTKSLAGVLAAISPKGPAAPLNAEALSLDPEVSEENKNDPLVVHGNIKNKTAFEFTKLVEAAKEAAPDIKIPTMIIHGEKDDIAYPQGSQELERLLSSSTNKRLKIYDGLLHEVLNHKAHFQSIMADLQAFWDSP